MKGKKIYESPLVEYTELIIQDVLRTSGPELGSGDDFGDWGSTNWGIAGGNS